MRCLRFNLIFILLSFFTSGVLHAFEYVAFSLKVAQERIVSNAKGGVYRKIHPEVFTLGGITAVRGLVYDRQMADIILVGERYQDRAVLTLDDFVVALRARFIHGKWPLVSIDPTEETKKTELQIVRFEGGIEDSAFGEDLFNADYRFKQISMGLLPSGMPELRTYWDLSVERAKEATVKGHKINSRFWFYPLLPIVSVRDDAVAIKGLKVRLFTEVMSLEIDGRKIENLSTFEDEAGDRFAKAVSDNFERLARVHPPLLRLQGLNELVALTKAMEEMDKRPDLTFWLRDYKVGEIRTEKTVKVLKRKEYVKSSMTNVSFINELSGGVQLMALALRLKGGDVSALMEAVVKTRPNPGTLWWSFMVGEWLIPTSPEMLKMADIGSLFDHAMFLFVKKQYVEAISLYRKIIELKPDWSTAYNNLGVVYKEKGAYEEAIFNFNKVLEIDPSANWAYYNRGIAYGEKGLYELAISDFNKALAINSMVAEVYSSRGFAYYKRGRLDQAISDYNKALEIVPKFTDAYIKRGLAYGKKGLYDRAMLDYTRALELNPVLDEAYINLGVAHFNKTLYDQAIVEFSNALKINPRFAEAYSKRGFAYGKKGLNNEAIVDFTKALEIKPESAEAYMGRGAAYSSKNLKDQALSDFNKALEMDPKLLEAHILRGILYDERGFYDKALSDFNKVLEIDSGSDEAYINRGITYNKIMQFDRAISDFNMALKINPRLAKVYMNRGLAYAQKGFYDQALLDLNKALEVDSGIAEAYDNLGVVYANKGLWGRACSNWQQACKLGRCDRYNYAKTEGVCK